MKGESSTRADLNPEARLRSILETVPDVILSVERDGTIRFINRAYPPLEPARIVGTSAFDYVPPASRERVKAALQHVFSTGGIDEYEVAGPPSLEGGPTWFYVRVGPLIEGEQVVAATLCATDVTARKREEASRRELIERLEKIASQVPGLVYQYKLRPDGSSCFPYASQRIREIYRVTPEQVREDASAVLAILHADDRAGVVESIQSSARTLLPWQHEYRVQFPDGEVRWLYGNSVPEAQADGSVLWHGFITDVTQRREAEQARLALQEQLRQSQKVESIGRLAGGVAHDFNNLLTSVLGFAELARVSLVDGAPAITYLDAVIESARQGAALTQQLLAYARRKVVRPELVDLSAVVRRMEPMLRRLAGEPVELELALADDLGAVWVDAGSMEQVIMNLALNARDAMPAGGRLTIATGSRLAPAVAGGAGVGAPPREEVTLVVSDTGTGMTAEVAARLFEPFFTTKGVGRGTGLGLAMCHGIVQQAQGRIEVLSEPGKGSRFEIHLPRATGDAVIGLEAEPSVEVVGGHECLLLVEDEEAILRAARETLTRLGYRVLTASDGVAALELAARTPEAIDLVIADVVMPRLGGHGMAAQLQSLRPGLRVLYASGYAADEIGREGVLEPGIDLLEKPYSPATLARRVRDLLDRR